MCLPPVPILSQLDPVHISTSYFLNIDFNISLPFKPGSPKRSLSLRFPHQNPVGASTLPHTCYMLRLSHSSWFYDLNNIWWGAETIKLIVIQSSQPLVTWTLVGPHIFLNTLFSDTLNLRSSLNVRYQDSHPYTITSKLCELLTALLSWPL